MAAMLSLAACARPTSPAPGAIWSMQASATAGAALIRSEGGNEVLRIACRRSPDDVWISTSLLDDGPGTVRLQIGEAVMDLVSEPDGPPLSASGPPSAAFPAVLGAGKAIPLQRGADASVAIEPPIRATAQAFIAACGRAPR